MAAAVVRVYQELFRATFPVSLRFYSVPPAVQLLARINNDRCTTSNCFDVLPNSTVIVVALVSIHT